MAVNLNPELVYAEALRRNQRAAGDHFDDGYYVWRLCPGEFTVDLGAPGATIDSVGPTLALRYSAIHLADAADQGVCFTRHRPKLWVAGKFYLLVEYTSNTGGTANFSVQTSIYATTKAGNLGTPTTLLATGSANWPGPTNAYDKKQYAVYATTSLTGDADMVGLFFKRIGTTDTNNNRLDIVAVTLTFLPSMREVHV